jgi:hypothetical protein
MGRFNNVPHCRVHTSHTDLLRFIPVGHSWNDREFHSFSSPHTVPPPTLGATMFTLIRMQARARMSGTL